jgi:hypothetical protein
VVVMRLPSFSMVACWRRSRSLSSGCHSGVRPLASHRRVSPPARVSAREEQKTWPRMAASD